MAWMTRRTLCAVGVSTAFTGARVRADPATDDRIGRVLADRVQAVSGGEPGVVVVAGLVDPRGLRIAAAGAPPADEASVFEIGSITKGFNGLLLADMALRGEVALDDPVARHLPASVTPPRPSGRPITLLDLATHTAGLPFMPERDPASAATLDRSLADWAPSRPAGTGWDYSNLGYWLLGEALAARAGMALAPLLRARVLDPLGQADTGFTLTPGMRARLVPGRDAGLSPARPLAEVPPYGLMPAAGGLHSTVRDLLALPEVALGLKSSPLAPAMALSVKVRRPVKPGEAQALGWSVLSDGGGEIVLRDGGTFGYAGCVAWDPAARTGVAVLSNQVTPVSDIARHLLRPEYPITHPVVSRRREIALEGRLLDAYSGRYEADGEGVFTLARGIDGLTFAAPADWGLPVLRLHAESERELFAADLPLRVTVTVDAVGRVTGLRVRPPRGDKVIPARRLD